MKLVKIALLALLVPACMDGAGPDGVQTSETQQDQIVGNIPVVTQYFGVTSVTPIAWTSNSPIWSTSTSVSSIQYVIRKGDFDANGNQLNAHVFIFANGNSLLYCYKVALSDLYSFMATLNYYAAYESGPLNNVKFWGIEGNVYIGHPPPPPPWPGGDQYLPIDVSRMQGLAQSHFLQAAAMSAIDL
ncbi:MAG TPA: hypothetical protein VGM88_23760 [Kofleriaceae bacterium]|jgi:hypothetical protein